MLTNWRRAWKNRVAHTRRTRPLRRPARRNGGLSLEVLEDRLAPATFLVNSLGDTGAGTGTAGDLRYCITQANTAGGSNEIDFAVTGTINLGSTLPNLNSDLTINGPGA